MLLKDYLLPFAFGDRSHGDLGDDVLEIGPGPGLITDLVRVDLVKLTAIELDPALASALSDRLTGTNGSAPRLVDFSSVRMSPHWKEVVMPKASLWSSVAMS